MEPLQKIYTVNEDKDKSLEMLGIISQVFNDYVPSLNHNEDLAAMRYLESVIRSRIDFLEGTNP